MSYFGEGTFRQDLLEAVERERTLHNTSRAEVIVALCEVMSYIAENLSKDGTAEDQAVKNAAYKVHQEWKDGTVSATNMRVLGEALRKGR